MQRLTFRPHFFVAAISLLLVSSAYSSEPDCRSEEHSVERQERSVESAERSFERAEIRLDKRIESNDEYLARYDDKVADYFYRYLETQQDGEIRLSEFRHRHPFCFNSSFLCPDLARLRSTVQRKNNRALRRYESYLSRRTYAVGRTESRLRTSQRSVYRAEEKLGKEEVELMEKEDILEECYLSLP